MFEIAFFLALLLGQFGRIELLPSVTVYVHDIVLVFYLLASAVIYFQKKEKRQPLYLMLPALLVMVICFTSLIANTNRFSGDAILIGAAYAARLCTYILLYAAIRRDAHTATYWLRWLFILGVAFAGIGLVQLYIYPNLRNLSYVGWDPHYYRLFSTLLDPNFMGALLLLSSAAGVAVMQRHKEKVWSISGLAVIVVALVLTFSRSSYVGVIVAICTYVFLTRQWKILYALLAFVFVIIAVPALGGESTALLRQVTAIARVDNWQDGVQVFLSSPIIGYGFNTIGAIPHNAPTIIHGAIARSVTGYDNSVLVIAVTTGIAGLAVFGNLGRYFVKLGLRLQEKSRELGILYIALLAGLLAHSMFINTLFYPQILICFWIFTAAIEKEMKRK